MNIMLRKGQNYDKGVTGQVGASINQVETGAHHHIFIYSYSPVSHRSSVPETGDILITMQASLRVLVGIREFAKQGRMVGSVH